MTGLSVTEAARVCGAGPVLIGEIFPLSGVGKVRVTYNWLYSGLNCDPGDQSRFGWVLQVAPPYDVSRSLRGSTAGAGVSTQPGQAQLVVLHPETLYAGMTLFASVRPDNDNFVGVQEPGSAAWITQAQLYEDIMMSDLGLLIVELQGFDNSYLGVNGSQTSYNDSSGNPHSGYRIQSNIATPDLSSKFFIAVQQNLQAAAQATLFSSLSPAEVSAELEQQGVADPQALAAMIFAATGR